MIFIRPSERLTVFFLLLFSSFALFPFFLNQVVYHYIGNNYFPPETFNALLILLSMSFFISIYFEPSHYLSEVMRSLCLFFCVMATIALLTNVVQFTPFQPIDSIIIKIEKKLHINLLVFVTWTNSHPYFKHILSEIYESLTYEMFILPIIILLLGYFYRFSEYCILMLLTALLGFGFYYFCPTIAPASFLQTSDFAKEQFATGIKFQEIHQGLVPSTMAGGMIALPSFHGIWSMLCIYLTQPVRLFFWCLLPLNILILCACVLLGWHYTIDLIGSFFVVIGAFFIKNLLLKRSLTH